MTFIFSNGYTPATDGTDWPKDHARIFYRDRWVTGGTYSSNRDTVDGFSLDALKSTLTYERWRADRTSGFVVVDYDHGSPVTINAMAIAAHNFGDVADSVQPRYFDTVANDWAGAGDRVLIPDNGPAMWIFDAPVTAQRWRLAIYSVSDQPEIGVLRWGNALPMPRKIYGGLTPPRFARNVVLRSAMSETGEFLGRSIMRTDLRTGLSWQNLEPAWINQYGAGLQRSLEREPFWIAWRPLEQPFAAFAQAQATPAIVTNGVADLFDLSMEFQALAHD